MRPNGVARRAPASGRSCSKSMRFSARRSALAAACFAAVVSIEPTTIASREAAPEARASAIFGVGSVFAARRKAVENEYALARHDSSTARVYLGVIVTLVAAPRQGPSPTRMKTLTKAFGVDRRTVERWTGWWREWSTSSAWREGRRRLRHPEEPIPRRVVLAFDAEDRVDAQASMMSFVAAIDTYERRDLRFPS